MKATANFSSAIFLTPESPYPSTTGGRQRDAQILSMMKDSFPIEVLCFETRDVSLKQSPVPITQISRERPAIWKRLLSPVQPPVLQDYSLSMEQALRERAQPGRILWVSRLAMARYIPLARALGYQVILDEHNVESTILMNAALSSMKRWHESLLAAQCKYYEERYCEASHAVVATSDIDALRLNRLAPKAPIHIIPNSVDSSRYSHLRENPGSTLFFSGALNYYPNVEGLLWFSYEVLPRIQAAMGDQMPRVVVSGAPPIDEVRARLHHAGIEIHTQLSSHMALLGEAAVVFVPIRSGGGNRLKILEAMAAGRAVVTTGKGAEGLVLAPTFDVMIADQADAFTSAIVKLLREPELRETISRNAIATVLDRYDWSCGKPLMEKLLSSLMIPAVQE